ncbi:hypothetical protein DPMN_092404 [Dreissena polymorpha]|uniref:Uncharacterized protein n=1 Tax=Dreissena polymorpha TaxID=45954 RepID=A0A9D4L2B4_DREPO|nr:hypothetical protein DPMN_092404 [Dreissena polymorpha]
MGNGANTGQLAYLGDTFTGSDGTETPYWTFGMRGQSGRRSLPSFVAIRHLLREIIAIQAPIMGFNGAQYGPVSVPSATLSPEAMALRTPYGLLA